MATAAMGATPGIPETGSAMIRTRVRETNTGRVRGRTTTTEGRNIMINIKVVTWSLALFSAVTYLVCITYGLVVPEGLHMTGFLEQVLPGFRWLTPAAFIIGLVEAFLYGVYAGLVFCPIYNKLWRRWGAA
jgi:hypothetical protein